MSLYHVIWDNYSLPVCTGLQLQTQARLSSSDRYSREHMSSLVVSRRQKSESDGERSLIEDSATSGDRLLDQHASTPGFVYVLAFFSALGGFLFGYDTGVVSGAMLLLKKEMNLSALWQELLISSTVGAAAVSALCGGFLNGWLGRKVCILMSSFIFTIGGIILSFAPDKVVLLVGRITVGLGIGIASMTVPVYIAEVSPPHLRGQLVTINSLFITGGQFIASVVDGAFSYLSHDGWRYMLGLSIVPAVLQFVGFFFLPESPRWLLQKGRSQEALQALSKIRGGQNVEEEYDTIRTSIEEEEKEANGGGLVILRIISHGPTRRALFVGCGLQMFQQLSGINTVMYYSATILQMGGVRDDKQAIWLAAATSATNFVFTLLGVWLVERVGRRKLTLGSLLGTGLSLTVLAVGFLLSAQNSPPVTLHPAEAQNSSCRKYGFCEFCMLDPSCGFCYRDNGTDVYNFSCIPVNQASTDHAAWGSCSNQTGANDSSLWAYNYCPTSYSWIVLLGLILYLAFFAPGMGPMPWTVNSEIYPLWARSTGNACSAGVNWIFNVLVSLTFLHVAQFLTYYGAFFLYTGLVVLGLLFVQGFLPETQGRQLEDIENLFTGPLCSCGDSSHSGSRQVQYIRQGSESSSAQYGAVGSDSAIAYITVSTASKC
ncbi:proton myo-inositol cotransporter isoform X1 [Pleuronectes platessa]|uniref:proton myo-inositol cotransporter isoform X1 n=1 Tax=Pleuronectes platessa TaxID=8262 RepID=UPI00232A684E|nr:proton myo-inositol cotransporter isoform X1 [Pleuronectes platessa]XP_053282243.1 proton myo-inositol cotransporter isoform X1 [Pleuronectes platessa]XP_053282244.1 proton myo-inositol cotransporter isoform X1 [Pleuronectes platessa]